MPAMISVPEALGMAAPQTVLAIDSTTDLASAALFCRGQTLVHTAAPGLNSSLTLLPLIAGLLAEAGITHAVLDALAFGAGPGSFTGLRVACGVAQGLAVAHDRPLLGIGSLDAMAHAAGASQVLTCLDARMNEVYFAAFADGLPILPPGVCSPGALPLPAGDGWVVAGNALQAYPALAARLAADDRAQAWAQRPDVLPTAASVLALALPRLARGEGHDAALAVPFYVRDKVAQTIAERLAAGGKA